MSAREKKLINNPETCVDECLQGLVAINPGLNLLQGHRVVIRSDIEEVKAAGKVTLVTGGGSGHDPMSTGFVGSGALSACVAGSVFASPPPASVLAAIQTVGRGNQAGTLVIVPNYTGDRLNFGLAAERAKALGLKVQTVTVNEDCALKSADKTAGRRGLCGIILVHKLAGALAEEGKSLQEIKTECQAAIDNMGTIGLSLSPCSLPGCGPTFQLPADEVELGLGIHGEAGVRRIKFLPVKEAVAVMLNHMTDPASSTHLALQKSDQIALMVNNLGGTSGIEMNLVAKEAIEWLENLGVQVERAYCGSFVTALEMAGVSLTILHLNDTRRRCLDAFTNCPGWLQPYLPAGNFVRRTPKPMMYTQLVASGAEPGGDRPKQAVLDAETAAVVQKAIQSACQAIGNNYQQLNQLDTSSGDGDCGSTLKRGTDAMAEVVKDVSAVSNPAKVMLQMAAIAETAMGGCSGAFYSLMCTAAAGVLQDDVSPAGWCQALEAATEVVTKYGGAEIGDRTMLDALIPAHQVLQERLKAGLSPVECFSAATQAAQDGAAATINLKARAGRASYVSEQFLTQPDPGAHAVGLWMRAAYEACKTGQ